MASVMRFGRLLFVLLLSIWLCFEATAKKDKNVLTGPEKLAALQGRVRDGVIPLDSQLYKQYVLGPGRPYHFFLLFTAMADKYNCEVCKQVSPEFTTLAESYVTAKQVKVDTRDGFEIFFGVVDFEQNSDIFGMHDFTSAPHIMYIAPDRSEDLNKRLPTKVKPNLQDMYNVYSQGKMAESIVQFVKQKTGFDYVIVRSKAFLYAVLAFIAVTILLVVRTVLMNFEKVLARLRRKALWMVVSLLFYSLSVSGMVYCIIREPPAYSMERNGKIKYFHPAGRSQFVVEGLIVGALDVAAAGFLILLSQWAIYLHRPQFRVPAIFICAAGFAVMYKMMISCYMFKNRWYTGWMGF